MWFIQRIKTGYKKIRVQIVQKLQEQITQRASSTGYLNDTCKILAGYMKNQSADCTKNSENIAKVFKMC